MKKIKLIKAIFRMAENIPLNKHQGIFGSFDYRVHTNNFKKHLKDNPTYANLPKGIFNPAKNERYKFLFKVSIFPAYSSDEINFHFGPKELWIYTCFRCLDKKENDSRPFVLSWNSFLEKNNYSPDECGLDGSGNYFFMPVEEGVIFFKKLLEWIKKHS